MKINITKVTYSEEPIDYNHPAGTMEFMSVDSSDIQAIFQLENRTYLIIKGMEEPITIGETIESFFNNIKTSK